MLADFLQFLFSGVTQGVIYGLVGLGFVIVFNASQVINFAQGEFVMIGGMATVFLLGLGLPIPVAAILAVALATAIGVAMAKFAVDPARGSSVVTIIIITIGASIFLRGAAEVIWDRNFHHMPAFSGNDPIPVAGAALLPQSVWVCGGAAVIVLALWYFFNRTQAGKASLATSFDTLAARLVGINTRNVLLLSFALASAIGATAGILIAPIALTYSTIGVMLGLKGFSAAILGGLNNPMGAVAGGLSVGIVEAMTAGYVSSTYKDAVAFVIILLVLFFRPTGLFGRRETERV